MNKMGSFEAYVTTKMAVLVGFGLVVTLLNLVLWKSWYLSIIIFLVPGLVILVAMACSYWFLGPAMLHFFTVLGAYLCGGALVWILVK